MAAKPEEREKQAAALRDSVRRSPGEGRLKLEGLPKIAPNNLAQVACILHVDLQQDLPRGGALTKHLFDGIARHNVNKEKDHG
jgi:hypothetical protein